MIARVRPLGGGRNRGNSEFMLGNETGTLASVSAALAQDEFSASPALLPRGSFHLGGKTGLVSV